jgi:hypothetical protein
LTQIKDAIAMLGHPKRTCAGGYLLHPSGFLGFLAGISPDDFSFSLQGGLGLFYEYALGFFGNHF